jgi:hypothetical protein
MKIKTFLSKITIGVIILIITIISSNLNYGKNHWQDIIESDAKGYYAYLPATFIYHDFNFNFFEQIEKTKYYNKNLYYDYRSGANGSTINKYYCGTAIAELPFFLIAHGISYLSNNEMDGYSRLYPVLISIAAIFYLFIGLVFLNKILNLYKISETQKSLVLIACVFGTNLFYYTVGEPGMSHVFSFAFVALFTYYAKAYFTTFNTTHFLMLGFILALIILIRPINGLIVFSLPFLASNIVILKQGFLQLLKSKIHLLLGISIFLAIVFIQFLYYKIATGSFIVYSYGEESFDFLNPHMIDILFSYRKGLFLYTPLFLLSLTGTYYLWQSSKFQFLAISLFLFLLVYVFSSWWMWYYGGSFSGRVFVEYIPFFMILLAISLQQLQSKLMRKIFTSLIVFFIILCQFQTYQYRYYIIHWSDMQKKCIGIVIRVLGSRHSGVLFTEKQTNFY